MSVARRLIAAWRPEPIEAAAWPRGPSTRTRLPDFLRGASAAPSSRSSTAGPGQAFRRHPCRRLSINLAVRPASIHTLLGPNGAGKTTTFNLISGMFPPDAGEIRLFEGASTDTPPDEVTQRGLLDRFRSRISSSD